MKEREQFYEINISIIGVFITITRANYTTIIITYK